jgi:ABC-type sugar transport system ATPase subunit
MNFLPATVAAYEDPIATVRLAGGAEVAVRTAGGGIRAGAEVTLGIRPEHMIGGGGTDAEIRGEVDVIERLGDESYLYVRLGEQGDVVVRGGGDSPAVKGEGIAIGIPAAACHLFDAAGMTIDAPAQD